MEHVFSEIAGPVAMNILRVAGTVNKNDAWTTLLEGRGLVHPRVDLSAVSSLECNDRRIDPGVIPKLRSRRGRNLCCLRATFVLLNIQLRRFVAVGMNQSEQFFIR